MTRSIPGDGTEVDAPVRGGGFGVDGISCVLVTGLGKVDLVLYRVKCCKNVDGACLLFVQFR